MLVVDVTPIDEANVEPAVIDAERALQVAQANWGREGTPEPFLVVMTDQSSIGSVDPIEGRPVWVVRYSDFTDMSPGGVELHWGYVIVDATSGEFIKSFLSK